MSDNQPTSSEKIQDILDQFTTEDDGETMVLHYSQQEPLKAALESLLIQERQLGRLTGIRDTYVNYFTLAPNEMKDRIADMNAAIAELSSLTEGKE